MTVSLSLLRKVIVDNQGGFTLVHEVFC
ncbi:hypothetical protein CY0110_17972 [Crocosphaera chwakensis CCY0110]|uniref:Uncharacterized protein n=1 Tax=Crocosphaera chwakensis CCY0110 TaxID=391612 RepID=A3IIS6_9CHRO|nr:hypothetical protein CY0110_17972 [Crocosphaera chwakensis CCY0110]